MIDLLASLNMLNVLSAFPLANTQNNVDRHCSCNYGKSILLYRYTCRGSSSQTSHCVRIPTTRQTRRRPWTSQISALVIFFRFFSPSHRRHDGSGEASCIIHIRDKRGVYTDTCHRAVLGSGARAPWERSYRSVSCHRVDLWKVLRAPMTATVFNVYSSNRRTTRRAPMTLITRSEGWRATEAKIYANVSDFDKMVI